MVVDKTNQNEPKGFERIKQEVNAINQLNRLNSSMRLFLLLNIFAAGSFAYNAYLSGSVSGISIAGMACFMNIYFLVVAK